jgi:hypothetical protein
MNKAANGAANRLQEPIWRLQRYLSQKSRENVA